MAHRELTKSRRRDFTRDEADGGAGSGTDGAGVRVAPRMNGGDDDDRGAAAEMMEVVAMSSSSWRG